jgi:hypothetical protein
MTGMIFTLFITVNATREQYGVWTNVFDIVGYFALLSAVLPFWTMRFVARGEEGAAKTGIVGNLLIGLLSTVIYLPLVSLITWSVGVSESHPELVILYFVVSAHIVELYVLNACEACLRSQRPQAIGYGLLIEETCKISLTYLLMVRFHLGLAGVMISFVTAILVQIIYYTTILARSLRQKIQWNLVREWLKGSVANIYNAGGIQLSAFVFILLFKFGGEIAKGDYGAAATIANIITYSFFLSFALYPKLLTNDGFKEVTTSLKLVLMFAIPMTVGAMAMPKSFLIILNPEYVEAAPVLFLLALDAFWATLATFFSSVLFGAERFDEKAKIPFKRLIRSNIFKTFTLTYVHSFIALPTVFFVLTSFKLEPYQAALCVTAINTATRFAMFIILCLILRNAVKIRIPWRNIMKYCLSAIPMAILLYVLPQVPKESSTFVRATLGLAGAGVGGILYLALLMLIDKDARALVKYALFEIRNSLRPKAS